MSELRPNLFDTDFERLVTLGRALLPKYAPEWTDHNLHDPGIMLIELLAWTAEAQMYSLGRLRTDERWAYGALLGYLPRGPIAARGLVWPNAGLPRQGSVLQADTEVIADEPQVPPFRVSHSVNLTAAQLLGVQTRLQGGRVVNHKDANDRPGAIYYPFGEQADSGDRFVLTFEGPLFAPANLDTRSGLLSLGVRVPADDQAAASLSPTPEEILGRWRSPLATQLKATLLDGQFRYSLPVRADGSDGFLRTGVILLDLREVPKELGNRFAIEFESQGSGLVGPPRILCIKPNVLPVVQQVTKHLTEAVWSRDNMPDQTLKLEESGIRFSQASPVADGHDDWQSACGPRVYFGQDEWKRAEDLSTCGPEDKVFTFDAVSGRIRFGNGINGKIPPAHADLQVDYEVTAGAAGNLPAGIGWSVSGLGEVFGTNLDPTVGGAGALDLLELRRLARRAVRHTATLVTSEDLEQAALGLPDLRVVRAESLTLPDVGNRCSPLTDTRTLVVLRARPSASAMPENLRWLAEVRRQLAPRLPLGERLSVIAPDYVPLRIQATLRSVSGYDPAVIEANAFRVLSELFALVATASGDVVWPLGRPVVSLDIKARLRAIDGVAGVTDCVLLWGNRPSGNGQPRFSKTFLPLWQGKESRITVRRTPSGTAS